MGKIVIETNYRRFSPVGQGETCADCPSYCKTACARIAETRHDLDPENDFRRSETDRAEKNR